MKKILLSLILFNSFAFAQVGIGNIDPRTALDVTGGLSLREGTSLTLSNGANNNVVLGTNPSSFYRITGPTAAFNIGSIVPLIAADGQIITLENTTAQNFTINHESLSGTSVNRIYCPGASNLLLSGQYSTVTLSYNKSQIRWIVIGSTDNPYGKNIQSVIGTTNINIGTTTPTDMADMSITFTPKHNVVFLNFGASGDMGNGPAQSFVKFQAINVNSSSLIAGIISTSTDFDYDDLDGYFGVTGWNTHLSMYPVNVVAGVSTTIKIQWSTGGIFLVNARNRVTANPEFSHRNLTIFD